MWYVLAATKTDTWDATIGGAALELVRLGVDGRDSGSVFFSISIYKGSPC